MLLLSGLNFLLPLVGIPDSYREKDPIGDPHEESVMGRKSKQQSQKNHQCYPGHEGCLDHEPSFERASRVLDAAVGSNYAASNSNDAANDSAEVSNLRSGKHNFDIVWGAQNITELSLRGPRLEPVSPNHPISWAKLRSKKVRIFDKLPFSLPSARLKKVCLVF